MSDADGIALDIEALINLVQTRVNIPKQFLLLCKVSIIGDC